LPLLLDDPLVHLDKQRLGEALKLFERIAAEHQILIFSHSDSLLRKAERDQWRIIALETGEVKPQSGPKKEKPDDDGQQLSFL
jgi:ABC-type molybdate transport system ATPase subunit